MIFPWHFYEDTLLRHCIFYHEAVTLRNDWEVDSNIGQTARSKQGVLKERQTAGGYDCEDLGSDDTYPPVGTESDEQDVAYASGMGGREVKHGCGYSISWSGEGMCMQQRADIFPAIASWSQTLSCDTSDQHDYPRQYLDLVLSQR